MPQQLCPSPPLPRPDPAFTPQEELADLSAACSKLWELDYARLAPGVDYAIDLQQGKNPYGGTTTTHHS